MPHYWYSPFLRHHLEVLLPQDFHSSYAGKENSTGSLFILSLKNNFKIRQAGCFKSLTSWEALSAKFRIILLLFFIKELKSSMVFF